MLSASDIVAAEARIRVALDELRPFLEADGGDISLESVSPHGVARVQLHGACRDCAMSAMTMRAGVEEAIKRVVPTIRSVEATKAALQP